MIHLPVIHPVPITGYYNKINEKHYEVERLEMVHMQSIADCENNKKIRSTI